MNNKLLAVLCLALTCLSLAGAGEPSGAPAPARDTYTSVEPKGVIKTGCGEVKTG